MTDVLVVVHDQLELVAKCVKSIYRHTSDFKLYLWDNRSKEPTRTFLEQTAQAHDNVVLVRHETNLGFIKPNNELARMGNSPYIILLNSDTEVRPGWDRMLVRWLKRHPDCKQVGYEGGAVMADGRGCGKPMSGTNIDYVCGWCFCISRETYDEYGLFDDVNLTFAYGEDSDYSMRLREKGHGICALGIGLVRHVGNATTKQVEKEMDIYPDYFRNHAYITKRHADYLSNDRVLL